MQKIIAIENNYLELEQYLKSKKVQRIFLVAGKSMSALPIGNAFEKMKKNKDIQWHLFSDYQPNPTYDSVVKGVKECKEFHADCIMAIGGGSAIDVAKCVKAYAFCDGDMDYIEQPIMDNETPFIVIPTTAGTGSEATHFAVIYKDGNKFSVAHESLIPTVVIWDARNLFALPMYQRIVTMLDAWGHAIEACWSLRATSESNRYATMALKLIIEYQNAYLRNEFEGNRNMQEAAYLAGKAINITQTTAAHAMSYKLTSLFGIAHGHAVAICLLRIWNNMMEHREKEGIVNKLNLVNSAMNCNSSEEAHALFKAFLDEHNILSPINYTSEELGILKSSVNQQRLKNYPIILNEQVIERLYKEILG